MPKNAFLLEGCITYLLFFVTLYFLNNLRFFSLMFIFAESWPKSIVNGSEWLKNSWWPTSFAHCFPAESPWDMLRSSRKNTGIGNFLWAPSVKAECPLNKCHDKPWPANCFSQNSHALIIQSLSTRIFWKILGLFWDYLGYSGINSNCIAVWKHPKATSLLLNPCANRPSIMMLEPCAPDPEGIFWRTQGMGLNDWGDNLALFEQTT